jgi:gluconokinase
VIVLVMGVSGVGKTTIGAALAKALGWTYLDADDYHPAANVAKMAAGTPLEDADRWPWLERINQELLSLERQEKSAVLSCSALKESYRDKLRGGVKQLEVVYLHGEPGLIQKRAETRQHRFMPAALLQSQLRTLEPPAEAISIHVGDSPEACVQKILAALGRG